MSSSNSLFCTTRQAVGNLFTAVCLQLDRGTQGLAETVGAQIQRRKGPRAERRTRQELHPRPRICLPAATTASKSCFSKGVSLRIQRQAPHRTVGGQHRMNPQGLGGILGLILLCVRMLFQTLLVFFLCAMVSDFECLRFCVSLRACIPCTLS